MTGKQVLVGPAVRRSCFALSVVRLSLNVSVKVEKKKKPVCFYEEEPFGSSVLLSWSGHQ